MTTQTFDPAKYKSTTREQWQNAAEAWHRWGPLLHTWLGPATETMLDMAKIADGHHVLDVAAGAGEQTISIARRVGERGRVLATDISPKILEHAQQAARDAGLSNVDVRAMDGESLDLETSTFDAVVSRVGLIYFPDRKRALGEMMRVLRPGGRVAAIVYSTPERNAFFSLPVSIIRRRANLGPPLAGQPGPFSLGGAGVLEKELTDAGFRDVEARVVDAPLRVENVAECVRFERESFGALHQMLSTLPDAEKEAAWDEISRELSRFEGPSGFVGPCELVVAVGTKSRD
jgi:ubiquinone/menaquinone biosynthesis C-methylase UbiE